MSVIEIKGIAKSWKLTNTFVVLLFSVHFITASLLFITKMRQVSNHLEEPRFFFGTIHVLLRKNQMGSDSRGFLGMLGGCISI